VQQVLLDGMKLVRDSHDPTCEEPGVADARLPKEAYGHLAAALRPQLAAVSDGRLVALASERFLPTFDFAFRIGAGYRQSPSSMC